MSFILFKFRLLAFMRNLHSIIGTRFCVILGMMRSKFLFLPTIVQTDWVIIGKFILKPIEITLFFIDFDGVEYVFYYELPINKDDYLFISRRSGRLPVIRHILFFDASMDKEETSEELVQKLLSVRSFYS